MRSRSGRRTCLQQAGALRPSEDEALDALRPSCPAARAIDSQRQTGVQREKRSTPTARSVSSDGSDQLPTTGRVSNGRRAYHSNPPDWTEDEGPASTPSFRPVLLAESYVKSASAAFPLGRPGESESSSGHARATGTTHPGFYGRKPWKKPNSTLIINVPRPAKEGLRRPFRRLPQNRSQNLTANPFHSRPGYHHKSPRLSLFRSSRFLIALRVSKSAVCRQLT